MTGGLKLAATAWMALTALSLLAPAAHAQMKRVNPAATSTTSTETRPWVDEGAYKAALKRIPDPKKPYDPWGQVHEDSAAKQGGRH